MTLGERLYQYRKNVNLSQDMLAEKVGVTRQTISKWETDQSTPEFNKIGLLCKIFGITPNELVYGENEAEKETENSQEEEKKRNKKKALVVSFSIFLYCMGTFSIPFMIESLQYDDTQSVLMASSMWAIATALLIYFFLANPKKKKKQMEIAEPKVEKSTKQSKIERGILELIAAIFLCIYLVASFVTSAWHITWILWIVLLVVELMAKLILDIRREEK